MHTYPKYTQGREGQRKRLENAAANNCIPQRETALTRSKYNWSSTAVLLINSLICSGCQGQPLLSTLRTHSVSLFYCIGDELTDSVRVYTSIHTSGQRTRACGVWQTANKSKQ